MCLSGVRVSRSRRLLLSITTRPNAMNKLWELLNKVDISKRILAKVDLLLPLLHPPPLLLVRHWWPWSTFLGRSTSLGYVLVAICHIYIFKWAIQSDQPLASSSLALPRFRESASAMVNATGIPLCGGNCTHQHRSRILDHRAPQVKMVGCRINEDGRQAR
jgi:hypothetical protein